MICYTVPVKLYENRLFVKYSSYPADNDHHHTAADTAAGNAPYYAGNINSSAACADANEMKYQSAKTAPDNTGD